MIETILKHTVPNGHAPQHLQNKKKMTNTNLFIRFIYSFNIRLTIPKASIRAYLGKVSNSIQHELGMSYPMLCDNTQVLRVQRTFMQKTSFRLELQFSFKQPILS